jgi:hypothetical protein
LLLAVPQQLSFFQFFNFLFVFVVFRRLLGGRFWLLATAGVGRLRRRRAEPAGGLMARRPPPEGRASTLRGRRREAERRGGLPPRPATRRRGRRGAAGAASGVERVGVRRAGPRAKGNSAAAKAVEQRLAHRPYGVARDVLEVYGRAYCSTDGAIRR